MPNRKHHRPVGALELIAGEVEINGALEGGTVSEQVFSDGFVGGGFGRWIGDGSFHVFLLLLHGAVTYRLLNDWVAAVRRLVGRSIGKTGAPEGAPRTATIFCMRQNLPDMSMESLCAYCSGLLNPITDEQ